MEGERLESLTAVSPVDGRYRGKTRELSPYLSEFGLIKERVNVELKYLSKLTSLEEVDLETKEETFDRISEEFSLSEAEIVKEIENEGFKEIPATNHDVKAVEYYLRYRLSQEDLEDYIPYIHFGLTSEDVTNLAYARNIKKAVEDILLPSLRELAGELIAIAEDNKNLPMLARTHGQPATPTTTGKEFAVYALRLCRLLEELNRSKGRLTGKLCGASGNLNAHEVAFPDVDWIEFACEFIEELGLQPNLFVTQIESRDRMSDLLTTFTQINNPLIDLAIDCWMYISMGYFDQSDQGSEVGSSTMPHKLNPIDFENCEGNLNKSNSDLNFISNYVTRSRLQRDLSDSTVMRNIGSGIAHSFIGYKSLRKGLGKLKPNPEEISKDLEEHHEVVTEAWQTVLRKGGHKDAYEMVKDLSKGKKMSKKLSKKAIEEMPVDEEEKRTLEELEPESYLGKAPELTERALEKARSYLSDLPRA